VNGLVALPPKFGVVSKARATGKQTLSKNV